MDCRTGEWMEAWTHERPDEWINRWLGGWMNGWVDGWINVNKWIAEWMDGCTDGPLVPGHTCTNLCSRLSIPSLC